MKRKEHEQESREYVELVDCWKNLGVSVVERAVEDVQLLKGAAIIKNGKCIDVWPIWNNKPLKLSTFFMKTHRVKDLLQFFKSDHGVNVWLDLLSMEIDRERITKQLGI